jgi:hypothetical protein
MRTPSGAAALLASLVLVAAAALAQAHGRWARAPSPAPFLPDIPSPLDLSGITWLGGDRYVAVSDAGGTLWFLRMEVSPDAAAAGPAHVDRIVTLADSVDVEDVAFHPGRGTVFVVEETGPDRVLPAIREHALDDGAFVSGVELPDRYDRARPNLGFEALTYDEGADLLYAAMEAPLEGDGPLPDAREGALVRILAFEPDLGVLGEWAYRVDPTPGKAPFVAHETSGVVALSALPDGRLLVLERALGAAPPFGLPAFRHRLYVTTPRLGPDVSDLDRLEGAAVEPLPKQFVWEGRFGPGHNLEGMTLGPAPADGAHLLLMVSDDGGGLARSLLPLKLELPPAEMPDVEPTS